MKEPSISELWSLLCVKGWNLLMRGVYYPLALCCNLKKKLRFYVCDKSLINTKFFLK